MLVLSRTRGEQIVVGGSITVTVLEVRGDKVRLGFEGPAEVPIHRLEVHQRLLRERETWCEADIAEPAACAG